MDGGVGCRTLRFKGDAGFPLALGYSQVIYLAWRAIIVMCWEQQLVTPRQLTLMHLLALESSLVRLGMSRPAALADSASPEQLMCVACLSHLLASKHPSVAPAESVVVAVSGDFFDACPGDSSRRESVNCRWCHRLDCSVAERGGLEDFRWCRNLGSATDRAARLFDAIGDRTPDRAEPLDVWI
jgi:hypothetical protein